MNSWHYLFTKDMSQIYKCTNIIQRKVKLLYIITRTKNNYTLYSHNYNNNILESHVITFENNKSGYCHYRANIKIIFTRDYTLSTVSNAKTVSELNSVDCYYYLKIIDTYCSIRTYGFEKKYWVVEDNKKILLRPYSKSIVNMFYIANYGTPFIKELGLCKLFKTTNNFSNSYVLACLNITELPRELIDIIIEILQQLYPDWICITEF